MGTDVVKSTSNGSRIILSKESSHRRIIDVARMTGGRCGLGRIRGCCARDSEGADDGGGEGFEGHDELCQLRHAWRQRYF